MVLDHLNAVYEDRNIGVACLYLNHKEADEQTPSRLLAGVWRQLVLGRDVGLLAKKLYQKYHEKGTTPSLDDIRDVLSSASIHYAQVYIIVDAVDEYPEGERWILLQHLIEMCGSVNLMITSRPHITPDASLPDLHTLEIRANEDDVRGYLDAQIAVSPRLSKHIERRPELREEIHLGIGRTLEGM